MNPLHAYLNNQHLSRKLSLLLVLLFGSVSVLFGGFLYRFMQTVAEEEYQRTVRQDQLVTRILLQQELEQFAQKTQGVVATYNFLLNATQQDSLRSRSVLVAMHGKLDQELQNIWLFDRSCATRTTFRLSTTDDPPKDLCDTPQNRIHYRPEMQRLHVLIPHVLLSPTGEEYGHIVFDKQLQLESWSVRKKLLENTSAYAVDFSERPPSPEEFPNDRVQTLAVQEGVDFYVSLLYQSQPFDALATRITLLSFAALGGITILLLASVRWLLRQTVTAPTEQLMHDVQDFTQSEQIVPMRPQGSLEFAQLYAAVHDMTTYIKQSRKAQLDQMEEMVTMRNKLQIADALGHISHEINRYLGAIRISAEFVKMMPDHPKRQEQMTQIEQSVDKCAAMLQDVMHEVRSGHFNLFNLKAMLEAQVPIYQTQASTSVQLQYRTHLEEIYFSKNLLVSAIENFIHNGAASIRQAKRDHDGQIQIVVDEYTHDQQTFIRLRVSDNGVGIPEHVLAKLGHQVVKSTKEDGNGFGLYSLGKLLRRHGGDLSFMNNPDGGATATLVFLHQTQEVALSEDSSS